MALVKLTDLSADTTMIDTDIVTSVKSPFGAGTNKKITAANLKAYTSASPTITGHATIEGVTLTGATGTGKLVTDTAPTISSPVLTLRTLASDPQHATPASRPAGGVGEIGYYTGKMYLCVNTATHVWELITSA